MEKVSWQFVEISKILQPITGRAVKKYFNNDFALYGFWRPLSFKQNLISGVMNKTKEIPHPKEKGFPSA